MLAAVLLSFGVIFVAELGDKSQLMALAFATRYRAVPVLIGITIATAVVHLVAWSSAPGSAATAADRLRSRSSPASRSSASRPGRCAATS